MTKTKQKVWYKSKSKWAGLLTGIGMILPGIIIMLNGGEVPVGQIWGGVIVVLGVWGIRDLPVLN